LIAPDIATCDGCVREIFTPSDRRFRYPFNNCTNCGPRFTIVIGVPYDRSLTTMVRFAMCPECVREYSDPPNRRFHAQPVSCPRCGPVLRLIDSGGNSVAGDPIRAAAERLRSGQIVAVKDSADFILRRTPLMKAQSPRYAGVSIASTSRSRSWCAT
jgi:hydrogenase maturation protein HypF